MNQNKSNPNNTIALLLVFLLLAIGVGGYLWYQNKTLNTEKEMLSAEVGDLRKLRTSLLDDINVMETELDSLLTENDTLIFRVEDGEKAIKEQRAEIKRIKSTAAKDAESLKAEVEQLLAIKKDMAALLGQLKTENSNLRLANQNLTAQNQALSFEVAELKQLTAVLEKERAQLMAASTRASNLLIDIRKKGDKPTGSSRRAKEISVTFEVKNLPQSRKGEHNVYLVIKDAKGLPVKVSNPVKPTVKPTGAMEEIIAQQMLTATLFEGGRLKFKIEPEPGSLRAGHYRVSIFTEWGLLGGAQFLLR